MNNVFYTHIAPHNIIFVTENTVCIEENKCMKLSYGKYREHNIIKMSYAGTNELRNIVGGSKQGASSKAQPVQAFAARSSGNRL